jgi:hypothetical protein
VGHAPGRIRDSILTYLATIKGDATVAQIREAVDEKLGKVPPSSVRSYLNNNTPKVIERTGPRRYRLQKQGESKA